MLPLRGSFLLESQLLLYPTKQKRKNHAKQEKNHVPKFFPQLFSRLHPLFQMCFWGTIGDVWIEPFACPPILLKNLRFWLATIPIFFLVTLKPITRSGRA
jgi:hypothetical protein